MYIIFALVVILAFIFLLLVLLGNYLPNAWRVDKAVLVQAMPDTIFPYINTMEAWQEWSVWNSENGIELDYEGPEAGPGAIQSWKSRQFSGRMTLTVQTEKSIEYLLSLEKGKFLIKGIIVLESTTSTLTQVAWRCESKLTGNLNPIYRFQAYFLKNYFEQSIEESLLGLQAIFANVESNLEEREEGLVEEGDFPLE